MIEMCIRDRFKAEYKEKSGEDFPDDPKKQLMGAIKAVFRSWDNPRANVYRRDNDIPYSWGTAVNVQSMAFGNMGDDCGTGVAFTRDPATGEKKLMGEFLTNAQGEDVVAGVRTPMPIAQMEEKFPEAFEQFKQVCQTLEDHYRDMQDMAVYYTHLVGMLLPKDEYDEIKEHVWVAKTATVAPTAYINGPAIIGPEAEVRHCAFIRGNAIVGEGAVVGNSTELKNVILFDKVQVPHYNYVGDSILGYKSHMGAGSITSNVKSDKKLVEIHLDLSLLHISFNYILLEKRDI